ncbi:hypothetical protein BS639_21215 [Rouxiella silvae]|uniref:DUF805 domain-containing protein n=1 Tax=Rouxiella silvae TaxID=1646373 RepID=A0ABX3TVH5_9GAMM|nr:hypothetical protein [Rouxiella silvae]ORJ19232.1 hypothetical protein BS639_21215 [Rouxiella silvae]
MRKLFGLVGFVPTIFLVYRTFDFLNSNQLMSYSVSAVLYLFSLLCLFISISLGAFLTISGSSSKKGSLLFSTFSLMVSFFIGVYVLMLNGDVDTGSIVIPSLLCILLPAISIVLIKILIGKDSGGVKPSFNKINYLESSGREFKQSPSHNPATGLPMVNSSIDVSGSPFGINNHKI